MKRCSALVVVLATALILGACGKKEEDPATSGESEGSKSGERITPPRTERKDPEPEPDPVPEPPNPAELLAGLTAENALEIREQLRADDRLWKSSVGPLYRMWASVDPQAALAAAKEENPKLQLVATSMALAGWTMNDPRAARAWFDENMTEPYQLRYAHSLVSQWPPNDFEDLAGWAEGLPDGKEKTDLITRMAGTWRRSEPAGAAQWLATLPAGAARDRATDFVFQTWGKEDPTAAGEFLAVHIDDANIDAAISSYARAVVPDDAEAAKLWAEEIADPRLRAEILEIIPMIRANPSGSPINFPGQ